MARHMEGSNRPSRPSRRMEDSNRPSINKGSSTSKAMLHVQARINLVNRAAKRETGRLTVSHSHSKARIRQQTAKSLFRLQQRQLTSHRDEMLTCRLISQKVRRVTGRAKLQARARKARGLKRTMLPGQAQLQRLEPLLQHSFKATQMLQTQLYSHRQASQAGQVCPST